MILVGDIGGTNTRLALFRDRTLVVEEKFPSAKFPSLEQIIQKFLQKNPHPVTKACFGIAGPIREGKCQATNLPWIVDTAHLSSLLKTPTVVLLNDLEAKAYGLRVLQHDEFFLLQKGTKQVGNQAMIAAGTGLGEAGLYWNGNEHIPFACEGGHTDFAPRNELEVELFFYLRKQYPHVSYERVVSGPSIPLLYHFLFETGKEKESPAVQKMLQEKSPSFVITDMAVQGKDPLCAKAIDLFLSIYGAESGNLALKMLSLGGLYIGGGIAPALKNLMKKGPFLEAFLDKGRFRPLLESMPVYIILNDDASLLGAAYFAGKL
jgi:glucokinase